MAVVTAWCLWLTMSLAAADPGDDGAPPPTEDVAPPPTEDSAPTPTEDSAPTPTEDSAPTPADTSPPPAAASAAQTDGPEEPEEVRYRWGGLGLPLVNYNSVDRLGFGAGIDLYDRATDQDYGYRYRLTVSTYWTTSGNYTSNYVQLERRGTTVWLLRATYRLWKQMLYAGVGGADVSTGHDDAALLGNRVEGPSVLFSLVAPVARSPVYVWGQAYLRYAGVTAGSGSLLAVGAPYGVNGGFYGDASFGIWIQEVDRFPMPHQGLIAEASVRVGVSASDDVVAPIAGVNVEAQGFVPIVGKHFGFAARAVFDKTFGRRPWFEQEWLGGRLRDESGYEQMFTGYGRYRPRGDGHAAALVQLKGRLVETQHPVADVELWLSAFAEVGWLFDGNNPGPILPSVGIDPTFVWQKAVLIRPFASWGWITEPGDTKRVPTMQFGISLDVPT